MKIQVFCDVGLLCCVVTSQHGVNFLEHLKRHQYRCENIKSCNISLCTCNETIQQASSFSLVPQIAYPELRT